eukprot:TRINITY_DN11529_c0_g1_i3.p1 TRINITY_DN11529_c0_g1~~TRINITY_DN11529_c0_g1_i3.p1  ORF type:complete len:850 (+),score=261.28 TRINITY_DN11529_c0_g1_i3:54-2603(+)
MSAMPLPPFSEDDLNEHLEQGDVSDTMATFFASHGKPAGRSTLSLEDVENTLRKLENLTTLDQQQAVFKQFLQSATAEDLRFLIRLIKHDLRIYAGPKNILDAINPGAYQAWQASNDLVDLIQRCQQAGFDRSVSVRASLMTPVKPMLAAACKSYKDAVDKCPNGILAEIKYDGERVQIHKHGDEFKFFSRSLKTVTESKISFFRESIKRACPHGQTMILDAEVLMVDTKTSKPLPFGTLGVHKREGKVVVRLSVQRTNKRVAMEHGNPFSTAQPCLFIFDILHFNGSNLMDDPLHVRRQFLMQNVVSLKNEIMYSEQTPIDDAATLKALMTKVMQQKLEGLVLKDKNSTYEPAKRRWLKMKRDYLNDGAMADSADLVVLGAWYGTGNKGGLLSTYLMGCKDANGTYRTVTKCGNGFDDAQVDAFHKKLLTKTTKISQDPSKVPAWIDIQQSRLVPDHILTNPDDSFVFEITGAEFSETKHHSADGISIRFPRITQIRDDKDTTTATSLDELKALFKASQATSDLLPHAGPVPIQDQRTAAQSAKETKTQSAKRPATATTAKRATTTANPTKKAKRTAATVASDAEDEYDLEDDFIEDGSDVEMDDSEDDDDDDMVVAPRSRRGRRRKRNAKPDGRTPCQYGASCYRKNPNHRSMFCHPGDADYPTYVDHDDSDDVDDMLEDSEDEYKPDREVKVVAQARRSPSPARRQISAMDDMSDDDDMAVPPPRNEPRKRVPAAPATSQSSTQSLTQQLAMALPDFFNGVVAWVDGNISDEKLAKRHVIAFDGDVAQFASDKITHIIVPTLSPEQWNDKTKQAVQSNPAAVVVQEKWLWQSIDLQRALATESFQL